MAWHVRHVIFALGFAALVLPHSAHAADICEAIALRDVPAVEDASSVLKRGQIDGAITQYRVNKKTGNSVFCSHGGYCYPTHILENERNVEALRLTNCKIGARDSFDDPDDIFYAVDVIRSAISPERLKIDDVDNRLLQIGLCSACAGNAAYLYVTRPISKCAQIVRAALEGNPDAVATLNDDPNSCSSATETSQVSPASAPSFDCQKAKYANEIAVCQDSKLAHMDRNLADLYNGLRTIATPTERRLIDADQTHWIIQLRACGADSQCIANSYKGRVRYLYRNRPSACDQPDLQQPIGCDPGANFDIE
jgi:hypothetical protein